MALEEQIKQIAEASLTDSRQFIVDIVVSARKGPKKVLIVVDGDEGLSIDDCAAISRSVGHKLEESAFLGDENYLLEVSTPGLDQPLKLHRQYQRNIGRRLRVKTREATTEGTLNVVADDKITLAVETGTGKKKEVKTVEIFFTEIETAFVLVSFK